MMKVLVLGATGMAGHTIALYFQEAGHEVTTYSRRKLEHGSSIVGDVTDFALLRNVILTGEFDAVINAVGILNAEAERDWARAVLINSYLPHFLSNLTCNAKTKVIQMSTDCVFSGGRGGYVESSLRDGIAFYDRSKALGEIENNKDLTLRNSIIGPDTSIDGIGLFNWFMRQPKQVTGFTQVLWTGVTTLTLAKAMEQAMYEDLTGVYHLVNNKSISKFELLDLFNKHIRGGEVTVCESDRPKLDKSLINTRTDFSFSVPDYETMIAETKQWIRDHARLYPHYILAE